MNALSCAKENIKQGILFNLVSEIKPGNLLSVKEKKKRN